MKKAIVFVLTVVAFAATLVGTAQPAKASSSGGTGHGQPGPSNIHGRIGVKSTGIHPLSIISCSGYGCDNDFAFDSNSQTPGTNCSANSFFVGWFSGEDHWSQIYYSNTCKTNWAYVSSPDGSAIKEVFIRRRSSPTDTSYGSVTTVSSLFGACAGGGNDAENYSYCDRDVLAAGQKTFMSNMLYAPVDQFQVCVYTQLRTYSACSAWH